MNTLRPLTGSFPPALVTVILCAMPAHAQDHLVQAWEAMARAERGEKPEANLMIARHRLACARSAPVVRAVKPRQVKAYVAECANLDAALAAL